MNQSTTFMHDGASSFESWTFVNGSTIHFEIQDDPEEMLSGLLEPEDWSWV